MECSELVIMVKNELRHQLRFSLPLALQSPPRQCLLWAEAT